MQGINFIIDDRQQKVAVVIDLQEYGDLWEDFYGRLLATAQHKDESQKSDIDRKISLRGSVLQYVDPTEPVAINDWNALQ